MRTVKQTPVTRNTAEMLKDEDGNVTIFSIFMLLLILLFTGAAVDIMRFEAVRAKMQSSMDRAVLAAADMDQQQDPELVVENYLSRSGIADAQASVVVLEGVNHRTVTASASTELDTFFLRMSGIDSLTAPARSVAEEKISNVEISLVMDISGSMRFNDRMTRMRPAAKAFVQKVMTDQSNGVTTLNLVPFAGQVNPGPILFDYYHGTTPKKQNQNNGWGNGDQDAPGNSLCNNNAENADEGATDPSCEGDNATIVQEGFFTKTNGPIENIVLYFDTNGDETFDRAHKIQNFPSGAPRDLDDIYRAAAGHAINSDSKIDATDKLLGISVKRNGPKAQYFQVYNNYNGYEPDLGPTKNNGKLKGGQTSNYSAVAWDTAGQAYTQVDVATEPERDVNMPSSCLEIYSHEFSNTDMPQSDDFVPHFQFWPIDEPTMNWGWCPDNDAAIQIYSDDVAALTQYIDDIRMHDGTGGQYGMKYGLALLDPSTRGAMSHLIAEGQVDSRFEGRPMDWEDQETEKFILFMTDGGITPQYRPVDPKADENSHIALQKQGSGTYYEFQSEANNKAHFQEQCDLAKQLGVTVFTVAFETSNSVADEVKACASSESHFFHVQGDEILDAFDTIARQINNLRLIQ